jgi:hypothetical protein
MHVDVRARLRVVALLEAAASLRRLDLLERSSSSRSSLQWTAAIVSVRFVLGQPGKPDRLLQMVAPILETPRRGWGRAQGRHYACLYRTRFFQETSLALLRQCLQELRTKRQEWNISDDAWPEVRWRQSEMRGCSGQQEPLIGSPRRTTRSCHEVVSSMSRTVEPTRTQTRMVMVNADVRELRELNSTTPDSTGRSLDRGSRHARVVRAPGQRRLSKVELKS